jgi:hypothetical protein
VVDYTFKPIEDEHCFNSWLADDDIDDTDNLALTTVMALIGCFILFIPIRLIKVLHYYHKCGIIKLSSRTLDD